MNVKKPAIKLIRILFPRLYCRYGRLRTERLYQENMRTSQNLSPDDRALLAHEREYDLQEWDDWLQELDDEKLVAKARKMDVDLDDIPLLPQEPNKRPSHYEFTNWSNRILAEESRRALRAKIRERAPSYRKERRETWALIIKLISFVIALIGAATGFVATLKH